MRSRLIIAGALLFSVGCGHALAPTTLPYAPSGGLNSSVRPLGLQFPKIEHVVVLIQENRSVDNLFQGFPKADTRSWGYDQSGDKITLKPVPLQAPWGVAHGALPFFQACDGAGTIPGTHCRMDGFNENAVGCGHASQPKCPHTNPIYSYVPHSQTKPYFFIGENYEFADHMFQTDFDESSFVSHLYAISAQDPDKVYDWPKSGAWGCGGDSSISSLGKDRKLLTNSISPCFSIKSLAEELDNAGISWRYYTTASGAGSEWSAYQAIKQIYEGPDWGKDVTTQNQFFTDVKQGHLPVVSWITPTCPNSDHAGPPCDYDTGPSWVASVVNAIGESKYWDSTLMFIFWDDPGGWYDHVKPPYADYDGLGMRIPLLVVSAYGKKGYVSHTQYEIGSIPKFIEDQWGLAPPYLGASDKRAADPVPECCDFTGNPRKFAVVPSFHDEAYFLRQPYDPRPPDDDL